MLSDNAGLANDLRVFTDNDTLHMYQFSDVVTFNSMNKAKWELKDAAKNKVKADYSNDGGGAFSGSTDLGSLPSSASSWTWKGELKDNSGYKYKVQTSITVN